MGFEHKGHDGDEEDRGAAAGCALRALVGADCRAASACRISPCSLGSSISVPFSPVANLVASAVIRPDAARLPRAAR